MNVNNFENSVDELQELCTAVQLYYRYRYRYRSTMNPLQNPNAWRLPEGTACMATAGSRNRYYPQPHLAQGSARIFGTSEGYSLWYLGPDSAIKVSIEVRVMGLKIHTPQVDFFPLVWK